MCTHMSKPIKLYTLNLSRMLKERRGEERRVKKEGWKGGREGEREERRKEKKQNPKQKVLRSFLPIRVAK